MRQWLVNPRVMCDRHLLGEHVESHMFVGYINKKIKIDGYINKGLVEVSKIRHRHDELVREMVRRGMKHNSILPDFKMWEAGKVDRLKNYMELSKRCINCKKLQYGVIKCQQQV